MTPAVVQHLGPSATAFPAGAQSSLTRTVPRVLIVQRIMPHYRVPFFRELGRSSAATFHFAYGRHRDGAALKSILDPEGVSSAPLQNVYLTIAERECAVYQHGLTSLIRSGAYDVVIAEFNPRIVSNLLACQASRRAGVKFIWWGHGMGPAAGRATARVRLALARGADAVIFYDDVQAARFISLGLPSSQAFVAPNSIDTGEISRLARDPEAGPRDRVLYVGRLVPEKKVDLLIRAFALARSGFVEPQKLTIVGDGPERSTLDALASSLGIATEVEFTGPLYAPQQLAPLFNSAWVSVSSGAVGLAAIHSLAYGLPLIVAREEPHGPEASALKDGRNALFFSANDADGLASVLTSLRRDRERWLSMARAARSTAESGFGLDRMVESFERAVQYVTQHPSFQ